MKYFTLIISLSVFRVLGLAQPIELTIETCYSAAEKNYPLVRQRDLIAASASYSIENISKGKMPQLVISGQATHQSDVTRIPVRIPGQEIPQLSKDQYRLSGEITQPLTDFVSINRQQDVQKASSKIQEQNLEVELYKIKDRINQLFFGGLLIDEQLKQNDLFQKDIQIAIDRTTALVNNGSEFKSNLDKLRAEFLRASQRTIELKESRKAFLDMLGIFINQTLTPDVKLHKPEQVGLNQEILRPELRLFEYQKQGYQSQERLIGARNLPKFYLFLQGGIGRPTPVNMLSNNFQSYYIGGLRLNWSLASFYTSSKERQILSISQQVVDTQKEAFLFNTNLTLKQQQSDISRLQQLLHTDSEIIALRSSIKDASKAQLENGVITVNDYLRELNAEDQAKQNMLVHEIQLLQASYTYNTTSGN